ncbi:competence/damage-inducible protein A [Sorangium sp. So ce1000]|uniref:competence/damage-inducible protein A n=1 Tax=Sorangium sp. So ce1000 TaxID=3133325 RepID=UPI003F5ED065
MRTAAALIIGNELLSGKIADENLVVLAGTLRALGVKLERAVMVLDELEVIAAEVRALAASHDWVFTSGGVGPTHDDLTIAGVARAFGVPVVSAPNIESLLREHYGDRLTEGHLLMARIPEGARLVTGGSAAWPGVVMRNVWMLPGVPQIFRAKQALIQAELSGGAPFVSLAVFTTLDEGQLKPMLDRVVEAHRDVDIGSYPRWSGVEYRTKLTFDGLVEARVRAARDAFAESLPAETIVRVE